MCPIVRAVHARQGGTCPPCPGLATTIHALSRLFYVNNMLQFSVDYAYRERVLQLSGRQMLYR